MANDTSHDLQKLVVYSVYVRNHTQEGTFAALEGDLARIRSLGADAIWLMPIHPLGEKARKGSLGSPYAIRDYRATNPEYGSIEEFEHLVDAIHDAGMKCLIDVVYNHTSPDSVLLREHPEYFFRTPEGKTGNRVGDWSDIIDLDYTVPELWDYQIETLLMWARIVDGFRCDVASFVPVEFWERARAEVAREKPGFIWLAETVHRSFGKEMRRQGLYCATDTEAYRAFDIEYAYDVEECFGSYLAGTASLSHYLDLLDFQECAYPANYNKLRFLENHDTERIASRLEGGFSLENLTAMVFFLKGATLIYAGQERALDHRPALFDRDPIAWEEGCDLGGLIERLAVIKHGYLGCEDGIFCRADDEKHVALLVREGEGRRSVGIFSLKGLAAEVECGLADGVYENLIDGTSVQVAGGKLACTGAPIIVSVQV